MSKTKRQIQHVDTFTSFTLTDWRIGGFPL